MFRLQTAACTSLECGCLEPAHKPLPPLICSLQLRLLGGLLCDCNLLCSANQLRDRSSLSRGLRLPLTSNQLPCSPSWKLEEERDRGELPKATPYCPFQTLACPLPHTRTRPKPIPGQKLTRLLNAKKEPFKTPFWAEQVTNGPPRLRPISSFP